ncbi:hypothetical protein VKT23_008269 [Stygiomarasmius scandens]|uniref:Uncharacterized protein n=1 Tax=Marasmiellus scandens TaxID=2682957 RepID=A0ABR1JME0_9AGAR
MNVASYTGALLKNYHPSFQSQEHADGAPRLEPTRQILTFPSSSTSPPKKRRRNSTEARSPVAGPSNPHTFHIPVDDRNADNAGRRISKAPNHYNNSTEMMVSLAACFKAGGQSVFSGTYTVPNDPPMSDKHRIQLVSNDIWRATGYRFTVKDHPPVKDGHKTRLWCSQDAQRRGKPNSKVRLAASGEVMAKTRYPCRSRLLISSRDAKIPGHRMITVRMYHHVAHEAYYDPSVPAPVLQAIWGTPYWPTIPLSHTSDTSSSRTVSVDKSADSGSAAAAALAGDWRTDSEEESDAEGEHDSGMEDDFAVSFPPSSVQSPKEDGLQPANASPLSSTPGSTSHASPHANSDTAVQTERFQRTMLQHIRNIREFCDGLEYQVQFNDFRMLDELETQGASFLQYVRDCLVREGRLVEEPSGMGTAYSAPGDL